MDLCKVGMLVCLWSIGTCEMIKGAYAKVTTHPDKSRSFYEESKDKTLVVQKNYSAKGRLNFITTFKFDKGRNPRAGKVEDPAGKLLLRIRYAYDRHTGRLAKAAYFDMVQKRTNKKTGKPQPVQVVIYEYDSDGDPKPPQVIDLISKAELRALFGNSLENATLTKE